jgi:cytoskeleton protein RodZ
MAEIEKEIAAGTTDASGQAITQQSGGLGALLRSAREQMGLNQQNLAEIIRLRRLYINALEEEAWDQLPAPVFVKGFIKSYARTVGLDEKRVLALYQNLTPGPVASSFPVFNSEQPRFRKVYWVMVVLFLVVILFVITYLWRGCGSENQSQGSITNKYLKTNAAVEQAHPAEADKQNEDQSKAGRPFNSGKVTEGEQTQILPAETDKSFMKAGPIIPRAIQPINGEWVLKAVAKNETWVMIYKDQDPPRDYTFMAGDKREWHAKKGFYLIVGNAAGMDFEINGVKVEKMGGPNQVITLRFPEDFARKENGQQQ